MDKSKIIEAAQQYVLRGQIPKAIEEWKKLLADTPNDAGIFNTIGDLYLRTQASEKAVDSYLQAGEIFKGSGFIAKAIAVFQKILKVEPNRKEIYFKLGEMNVERGMVGNARENYLKAAKLYAQEGKIRESLEIFRKIADLDPNNLSVRAKIAETFLKEGLKEEAIDEYSKIADSYLKNGQSAEAEKLYRQILGIEPGNRKASIAMGRLHLAENHPESAIGYARKILDEDPLEIDALSLLLDASLRTGQYDDAEETVRLLMASDPACLAYQEKLAQIALQKNDRSLATTTLIAVGSVYQQQKEYQKTVDSLSPLLGFSPVPLEVMEILFESYQGLGERRGISEWGIRLGKEYGERGKQNSARAVYEKMLEWDPSDDEARVEMERLPPMRSSSAEIDKEVPEGSLRGEPAEFSASTAGKQCKGKDGDEVSAEERIAEYLTSSDIYVKYGLMEKAMDDLRAAISLDPNHEASHLRLKEIYRSKQEYDKAVEECLILSEIYASLGETEKKAGILRQAHEILPGDERVESRLQEMALPSATAVHEIRKSRTGKKTEIGELWEEAEFYAQQGMDGEAVEVCKRILALEPGHKPAQALLDRFQKPAEEMSIAPTEPAGEMQVNSVGEPGSESRTPAFFDFEEALKEEDVAIPSVGEDTLKSVEEIFQEFRKGVRAQLEDEDYETHFNLGIAYKEMGLYEEAIEELLLATKGDSRFMDASHMIAQCHREVGRVNQAIEVLDQAILDPSYSDFRHRILKYEKALLLEQAGRSESALSVYSEIYNSDPTYQDVAERILHLQKSF